MKNFIFASLLILATAPQALAEDGSTPKIKAQDPVAFNGGRGTCLGVTPDNRVIVKNENGDVQTFTYDDVALIGASGAKFPPNTRMATTDGYEGIFLGETSDHRIIVQQISEITGVKGAIQIYSGDDVGTENQSASNFKTGERVAMADAREGSFLGETPDHRIIVKVDPSKEELREAQRFSEPAKSAIRTYSSDDVGSETAELPVDGAFVGDLVATADGHEGNLLAITPDKRMVIKCTGKKDTDSIVVSARNDVAITQHIEKSGLKKKLSLLTTPPSMNPSDRAADSRISDSSRGSAGITIQSSSEIQAAADPAN